MKSVELNWTTKHLAKKRNGRKKHKESRTMEIILKQNVLEFGKSEDLVKSWKS